MFFIIFNSVQVIFFMTGITYTEVVFWLSGSEWLTVRGYPSDLCLNMAVYKANLSVSHDGWVSADLYRPCHPWPTVSAVCCVCLIDKLITTWKWILYFVVVGTGLFLPPLFCVVILRVSCYCNRFIRIEKWIFPSVMWHGKSLLNYSMALMWSTHCAWWLDLQGLLCYEENFEFYDLSGKNGTGSGFCQAHPNCCRKPPNETSKYGTCENSEEQDFIQTSLVWCWKHQQPVWPLSEIHLTELMLGLNIISPTMLKLQKTSGNLATFAATIFLLVPNLIIQTECPACSSLCKCLSILHILSLTSYLVAWNLKIKVTAPIYHECQSCNVWFPDIFYKRTALTSFGKNPEEHAWCSR